MNLSYSLARIARVGHWRSNNVGKIRCFAAPRSARHHPRRRRVEMANARRFERILKAEEKSKEKEKIVTGEQILSESGMRWGFFFTLGVFPLIGLSVMVSTTPELQEQFNAGLASIIGSSSDNTQTGTLPLEKDTGSTSESS